MRNSTITATMLFAAREFLAALSEEQRAQAQIPFEDEERFNWHFTPRMRRGLPLGAMDDAQRALAHGLISTGVSSRGYLKAMTIISLEPVLRELEGGRGFVRDAGNYYVSVFGTPSPVGTWGWRVEGHHISFNLTIVDGELASSPSFFGANPAEVRHGPRMGLRALAAEEDLARELLRTLSDRQRAQAIIDTTAPRDILTYNRPRVEAEAPRGIPMSGLTMPQVDLLMALLDVYASDMPEEVAEERRAAVRRAHWDSIYFAWMGGQEPGQGHYYRVQGPEFLVEYDNTQNEANHIHAVWRDYDGDFGQDLLRAHYRTDHAPAATETVPESAVEAAPTSGE